MFKKVVKIIILAVLFLGLGILLGFYTVKSNNKIRLSRETANDAQLSPMKTVTGTLTVLTGTYDKLQNFIPISSVNLVILNQDGHIVSKTKTVNGSATMKITVPRDKKFDLTDSKGVMPRGDVTIVSFKKGYVETVVFDVAILGNNEQKQLLSITPINENRYRDQVEIQIGNINNPKIDSFIRGVAHLSDFKVYGRY